MQLREPDVAVELGSLGLDPHAVVEHDHHRVGVELADGRQTRLEVGLRREEEQDEREDGDGG